MNTWQQEVAASIPRATLMTIYLQWALEVSGFSGVKVEVDQHPMFKAFRCKVSVPGQVREVLLREPGTSEAWTDEVLFAAYLLLDRDEDEDDD